MLEKLGFDTEPGPQEPRYDIIQTVTLKTPENLKRFCRGIQAGSPVDSYVTPEPWQMRDTRTRSSWPLARLSRARP